MYRHTCIVQIALFAALLSLAIAGCRRPEQPELPSNPPTPQADATAIATSP